MGRARADRAGAVAPAVPARDPPALAEFKPDLVFQIDHLRHEHGDMFPPNLPFVCWVQDHLPQPDDAARRADASGRRDFVLTDAVPTYVDDVRLPAAAAHRDCRS